MQILKFIENAVTVCSRILKFGAGIQSQARNQLIADLQAICSNVEGAYSTVLARLRPVKDSYSDTAALATTLRDFAADRQTRDSFKPDHLCGHVDRLLSQLESNLDPLKYSVDVKKIETLRHTAQDIGNVDRQIYHAYDDFTKQLDDLSTELQTLPTDEAESRRAYARHLIDDFQEDLFAAIGSMRSAKDRILR